MMTVRKKIMTMNQKKIQMKTIQKLRKQNLHQRKDNDKVIVVICILFGPSIAKKNYLPFI